MKWDVDFQCFVIRGGGVSRGRQAGVEQVSSGCSAMDVGISVVYYLLTVASAWATSYRAFKQQVPALNMDSVQGSGHGNGRWTRSTCDPGASMPGTFNSRHRQAES